MSRRIAHLDMDAFYASVELLRYPQLRGLPLVVGGSGQAAPPVDSPVSAFGRLCDYVGRGVATTASYEARALGVHSAMGLMKAGKLAPDAILLPADFDRYRQCSQAFKTAVARLAPCIEDRGIDEIYLDLSSLPGDSRMIGHALKDLVRQATGLSCSIGITPNKLLAKIASELDKPDGLTILEMDDVPGRIWPLAVRKVNGIGPKANARLEAMGIRTIGELARVSLQGLVGAFGVSYGQWLWQAARGLDERPVVSARDPKSISRETTFERDLDARLDRAELTRILLALAQRLAQDLQRKQWLARTIGVKLRYRDFSVVTRDQTLPRATGDAGAIVAAVRHCLKRVSFDQRLRLLGIRASGLQPALPAGVKTEAAATQASLLSRDWGLPP